MNKLAIIVVLSILLISGCFILKEPETESVSAVSVKDTNCEKFIKDRMPDKLTLQISVAGSCLLREQTSWKDGERMESRPCFRQGKEQGENINHYYLDYSSLAPPHAKLLTYSVTGITTEDGTILGANVFSIQVNVIKPIEGTRKYDNRLGSIQDFEILDYDNLGCTIVKP